MRFGTVTGKQTGPLTDDGERQTVVRGVGCPAGGPGARQSGRGARKGRGQSAFTLIEVLVAMLFMAIVIPVAMDALHVSSEAGEISTRRAEAARVADRILNENIVMTNWTSSMLSGTTVEGHHEFRWTLQSQFWPEASSLQLLVAEVKFNVRGKERSVRMNTLAVTPVMGSSATGVQ